MKEHGSSSRIAAVRDNHESTAHFDRRAHTRRPFSALAEIVEPRSLARLTCRATDLSFGGIYVDTISPFAVGTSVMVRLTCEGRAFQAKAQVSYSLNGMGMGLAFASDLPLEQASALHSWIAELSGELQSVPAMEFDAPDAVSRGSALEADSLDRLREGTRNLVDMLMHKQVLTEFEARALRSKLVR